jgi:hypothetical protein
VNVTVYRVGVLQYLILGAFMQVPDGTLTYPQLCQYVNLHRLTIPLPNVVKTLWERGCIDGTDDGTSYRITEYGMEARRSRSTRMTAWYLPVPREWSKVNA